MAALVVAVGLVVVGALLAVTIGPLARNSDVVAEREANPPAAADGDDGATSAPLIASTPSSPPRTPSAFITFDLHPVGPLEPDDGPITRIVGAPEVASFPTPFDRSLRLGGEAAGVCIGHASPPQGGAPSMSFDLHLGEAGEGGTLSVGMAATGDAPAIGLGLDLTALGQLDREAWYRLTVTGDDQAGTVEVTRIGDDRPVVGADLGVDPTIVPTSPDEFCIQSSLPAPDAALFTDNLRVDR